MYINDCLLSISPRDMLGRTNALASVQAFAVRPCADHYESTDRGADTGFIVDRGQPTNRAGIRAAKHAIRILGWIDSNGDWIRAWWAITQIELATVRQAPIQPRFPGGVKCFAIVVVHASIVASRLLTLLNRYAKHATQAHARPYEFRRTEYFAHVAQKSNRVAERAARNFSIRSQIAIRQLADFWNFGTCSQRCAESQKSQVARLH
jgi:hypothetical protein